MASVHMALQDIDEAVQVLKEGEAISKKDGSYAEQAQMKLLAAQVYRDRLWLKAEQPEEEGKPQGKSLKWLYEVTMRKAQGAVRLARSAEDPQILASALQTLGYIYYFDHKVQDTMLAAEEALDLFRTCEDKVGEVHTLALMGQSNIQKGDREAARTILQEAAEVAKEAGDEPGQKLVAEILDQISKATPAPVVA